METFSVSLALCTENSPVTGEFPWTRPATRGFDVFSDPSLNKRLSKQSWGWWFETPSRSLSRHCHGMGFALVQKKLLVYMWPATKHIWKLCHLNTTAFSHIGTCYYFAACQPHFLRKIFFFSNFVEVGSFGPNWQSVNIGLCNGSAPNRREAITWTSCDEYLRRDIALQNHPLMT